MSVLYKADPARGEVWARVFAEQMPEQPLQRWPDIGDPLQVRYAVVWQPPPDLLQRCPNLQVLFSIGAGADQLEGLALPPALPVVRMIEPGLTAGMTDYVSLAVLALHRQWPLYLAQQRAARWVEHPVRLPAQRRVGVMGLGELGRAALARLRQLGFDCAGWSRSRHALDGVATFAGRDELPAFAARCDILVCLLPLTRDTRGILDAALFAALPQEAAIVNVGRGGHLVEPDLLHALEAGQLSAAVLDVCEPEPLPPAHPFWHHPRIWLTPHVASMTQPESAARAVIDNIRRFEAGEPLRGQVDRQRGY